MSELENFKPMLKVTRDGEITGDYWTYIFDFELRKQREWAEYQDGQREEGRLARELKQALKPKGRGKNADKPGKRKKKGTV